jgi:hypothetical protein
VQLLDLPEARRDFDLCPGSAVHTAFGRGRSDRLQFNKKIVHHLFCSRCGVGSFARGTGPDGSAMIAVNVRCLDDVDLAALSPMSFDGKSL